MARGDPEVGQRDDESRFRVARGCDVAADPALVAEVEDSVDEHGALGAELQPALAQRPDGLIETKRPQDYDRAVQLMLDLRDLAVRSQEEPTFEARLVELRARHAKKPSLLARLDRAGLILLSPTGLTRQSV